MVKNPTHVQAKTRMDKRSHAKTQRRKGRKDSSVAATVPLGSLCAQTGTFARSFRYIPTVNRSRHPRQDQWRLSFTNGLANSSANRSEADFGAWPSGTVAATECTRYRKVCVMFVLSFASWRESCPSASWREIPLPHPRLRVRFFVHFGVFV